MSTHNTYQRSLDTAKWFLQRCLGVFIIWQLFYMTIANSLETLEIVTHRMPETSERIGDAIQECRNGEQGIDVPGVSSLIYVVDKYGQFTEQPQRWSLFAPNIRTQSTFLALELRFDDFENSLWLLSDNEPVDTKSFFRVGGNRLRGIEQNLEINFAFSLDETEEVARERWREQIQEKLARDSEIMQAWIALRVKGFLEQNPQAPEPNEIVIHVRGYEIPSPDASIKEEAGKPYEMAIARWIPDHEYPEDVLPIEAFDPVTNQFVYQPWESE